MSRYNYIATYYSSSAVNDSLIVHLKHPTTRSLCVAKGKLLEIYQLENDQISRCEEIDIKSYIYSLSKLTSPQGLDSILILTHSHKLWQISYNNISLKTDIIDITVKSRMSSDYFTMAINSYQNLLCINDYSSYLRILKIMNCKVQQNESFFVDYTSLKVIDLHFIKGSDILVGLFIGVDNIKSWINFYALSATEQTYTLIKSYDFPEKPGKIIESLTGEIIVFLELSYYVFIPPVFEYTKFEYYLGIITAKCEIDLTRWILINSVGGILIVHLGPLVNIKHLGNCSGANSISYLDNNIFYLASRENHSKLIQVLLEPENNSYIKELQDIIVQSPIYSIKSLKENDLGILSFLTASGTGLGGGFYTTTKAITIYTECQIDLPNIIAFWSLNINSNCTTHIILSFYNQTRALACIDSTIKPISLPLITTETTLLISLHNTNIIQITPSGIYFFSNTWEPKSKFLSTEFHPDYKFFLGYVFENTLCIILKSDLLLVFSLTEDGIKKNWEKQFEMEIACITGYGEVIGIGFWVENSVLVINKNNGERIFKDILGFPAAAKSLKFVKFQDVVYLLVGMKDGHLVYYNLNDFRKTCLRIGYQAVELEEFTMKNKNLVIAASDKSIIIYSDRNKITYSSLNCERILLAASFNTESYPHCMAVIMGKKFSIISFEDFQKYSIEAYIKGITLVRLDYLDDMIIAIAVGLSQKFFLKIFDARYEETHSICFNDNEVINCIKVYDRKIYIGIGIINNTYQEIDGSIMIYEINDYKFKLVNELKLGKTVKNIVAVNNNFIFSSNNELIHCKIIENSLQNINTYKNSSAIIEMDALNEYIALLDINSCVQLLTIKEDEIVNFHKYSKICNIQFIKILSSNLLCASDLYGNIIYIGLEQDVLLPLAGFNLEKQLVNCMDTFVVPSDNAGNKWHGAVYATSIGEIGIILNLSVEEYKILKKLQEAMIKSIDNNEKIIENLHKPISRGQVLKIDEFINGDLIEKYLDMPVNKQNEFSSLVFNGVVEDNGIEKLNSLIYALHRLH